MATKTKSKKTASKGGSKRKTLASVKTEAKPKKIHPAPKTLTATELLDRTLNAMEEENQISRKIGKDFMESLSYVVQQALEEFNAVSLAGLVKITPRLHEARTIQVREEFGNPESKLITKKMPVQVKLKANALKKAKDATASPQKARTVLDKAKRGK